MTKQEQLTHLIYINLLEWYLLELENENQILNLAIAMHKLEKLNAPIQPTYPWDKTPYNPQPPWVVTCQNTSHTAT